MRLSSKLLPKHILRFFCFILYLNLFLLIIQHLGYFDNKGVDMPALVRYTKGTTGGSVMRAEIWGETL